MMKNTFLIAPMLTAGLLCGLFPMQASSSHAGTASHPAAADFCCDTSAGSHFADASAVPTAGPFADNPPVADSLADEPYLTADPMPAFQGGGVTEFCAWVRERLVYPAEAAANGIQGRVTIAFVVERDGSLSTVETVSSPDASLSEAAVSVVRQSPRWTPGGWKGRSVRVRLTIPIEFILQPDTMPDDASLPSFLGDGLMEFKQWVLNSLELPDEVFFPGDEGWVEAEFSVSKKGKIRQVETPDFTDPDFAECIRRAIASSPPWPPAPKTLDVRMRFDLLLKRNASGRLYSEDNSAYTLADKLPLFGGGSLDTFDEWAYERVDSLLGPSASAPEAVVLVQFVIERDGTTTDIHVSMPGDNEAFSQLVRRAIDDVPLWTPAEIGGRRVRFQGSRVLDFRADSTRRDGGAGDAKTASPRR